MNAHAVIFSLYCGGLQICSHTLLMVEKYLNFHSCFPVRSIEYRSVTSQKDKFVKLWDLVPFSSKASLEKGPCQKLPLNCNSQPKYKG